MRCSLNLRSPTVVTAIGVAATLILALLVVFTLLLTTGANAVSKNAALIGALVALGGVFTAQMVSIALAERRAQGEALQTYLDKMSELLIDKKLHKKDDPYDVTRVTARAQTLAVLRRIDGGRKRVVLLFLREARLINRDQQVRELRTLYPHIVALRDADLKNANLRNAPLINASRDEPISLEGAILQDAVLQGADLERADLQEANLIGANLIGANLRGANLRGAKVTDEQLGHVRSLQGAIMPDGTKHP
jgi:uncharacterized protein YjbI with pentapeptide repeats